MCSDFESPAVKTSEKGNAEHGVAALLDSWVHLLNYISPFYYNTWEYLKSLICVTLCEIFVTTAVPKFEKLIDQSLKDARDTSFPLVHQFN